MKRLIAFLREALTGIDVRPSVTPDDDYLLLAPDPYLWQSDPADWQAQRERYLNTTADEKGAKE